jgi:hypothetical protein
MLVSTGKRAGRSHRDRRVPCQDAFAVHQVDGTGRLAAAVADGLGSRPLSHIGSEAAAQAAAQSLAQSRNWGPGAVHRAFRAARKAIRQRAKELGVSPDQLATTLQVAGLEQGRVLAGLVGDGAILYAAEDAKILLAPEDSEYANHVVPITSPDWQDHLRVATAADASRVLLFTDGLTRLLLTRASRRWEPYRPFFDAFLPTLRAPGFDAQVVPRFLESERIDGAWDDDKCLVVMGLE